MTGYYQTASDDEINEALRAFGFNKDIRRFRDTPNGQAAGGHINLQHTGRAEHEVVSDPDQHAANLAEIRDALADPDPEPFDAGTASNAEIADYATRNGLALPSALLNAARERPHEHAGPSSRHRTPEPPTAA